MKTTLRRTLLTAAIALASAPAFAQSTESPFSQTVFFGDSLTDGGFFRSLLPANVQNVTGQFTTNPGFVWSQYLADYYDSNANVAWKATGATPTLADGNNWAAGGARVGTDSVGALGYTPSLASQYARYLSSGHTVDRNALYTVWGGANDLFAVQANPPQASAIIGAAVGAQVNLVGALTQAGAQYILVPTIPDLGLTPSSRAGGAVAMAQGTALANSYNTALFGSLASAGLRVIPLDTFHFLQEVVANPGQYGISNVTGTACQPQITAQSLTCNPSSLVDPGAPNSYLFADGVHPTSGAHKAIADFAISVIEGPRQIAILPRSAAMVGRARSQVLDDTITRLLQSEGDGNHWWGDLRADQQRYNNPAGFDGPGLTGGFGVGRRSGNLTYGGFAQYGRQEIDFGERRGDFRQTDAGLGGFIGWEHDAMWASGQLSWTKLGFDVDRQVNLGQASRVHGGSADGDNLSLGGSAGWNFTHGALVHGPVVSVLMQKISIDGYTEDSTESTALAYPDQDGDSLVGSVGWQANFVINKYVKPYARLTWDREFEDGAELAWAQSVSMPGSLPYAVPGLAFDKTSGTLTYGIRGELFGLEVSTGSNLALGQKGGDDANFFLTVGGKF
ncbi:MAG TPA: autotransporter domain-containing protein [Thermomonas sp.]|nr:autotransporter domain-containing protein [Thermomonas sp.]